MRLGESAQFTLLSGAVAAATAGLFALVSAIQQPNLVRWVMLGWSLAALPGLASAGRLVRAYGVAGSGFLKIVGGCFAVRMVVIPAGAYFVVGSGKQAILAYTLGLFAGYVPTQACEAAWFLRRSRREAARWTSALVSGRG